MRPTPVRARARASRSKEESPKAHGPAEPAEGAEGADEDVDEGTDRGSKIQARDALACVAAADMMSLTPAEVRQVR